MIHKALLEYLHKHIGLSSSEEDLLLSKFKSRKYLKGQFIIQQGDICKHLSFVTEGCLKTFHIDHEGQEHIIRFAIENWWAMDLGSFISQEPADCNVKCLENTHVLQIHGDGLADLYEEIPKFERVFRIIFQNAFVASEKRIMVNFSQSAKDRYLLFQKQYPQIEQRVPQYMIASYLGITKQYLSEIRNQLMHD